MEDAHLEDTNPKDTNTDDAHMEDAHPDDPYLMQDATYISTDPNWRNKQRVLVFASRGIGSHGRHIMNDMRRLMPHSKEEVKFEKKMGLKDINEVCELKSCNNCMFFEARKDNLYMYLAKVPHGPTMKFEVLNMHTLGEIKLSGNCLHGSRPILSFDTQFDTQPHLILMKEIFTQIFGTPRNHPKSKPFHDHVMSFHYEDAKVSFRHYQISPMTEDDYDEPERQLLTEIGPRYVLDPIRFLDGAFVGKTIYLNEAYATPTAKRSMMKQIKAKTYEHRLTTQAQRRENLKATEMAEDPTEDIF
eukprot:GEMP01045398.1.p1 GENE.GEMP01045398.1~~GEMP01045398.1.p1  ORF type:complete len:316 (-),score=68.70 GEMP01045398.1:817-1722(-)